MTSLETLDQASPQIDSSFGTSRRLAIVGLYAAIGALLLDFVASIGLASAGRGVMILVIVAVAANFASAAISDSTRRDARFRQALPVVVLLGVHCATRFIGAPRTFDGDAATWLAAHVLLISTVLVARNLTVNDLYNALLVTSAISLSTLALGDAGLSHDARTLPGLSGRLKGIYGHPNVTAIAGVLLLVTAFRGPKKRTAGVIVGVSTMAATASLTGVLAALVALSALWLGRSKAGRSGLTFALLLGLATPALIARNADPALFTGRVHIWNWALELSFDRWNGIGSAVFSDLRGSLFPISWFHAHNQILMDYVTGGRVLVIVTLALILALRMVSRESYAFALWSVLAIVSITEIPMTMDYPGARVIILSMTLIGIFCHMPDERVERFR